MTDRDRKSMVFCICAFNAVVRSTVRTCRLPKVPSWSVYMILIEIFHLDVLYVLWCRLSISLIRSLDLLPTFRALQLMPAT